MKQKITWAVWAVLYMICLLLGILGRPGGIGNALYFLTALIFFIPGTLLLYWGISEQNRKQVLGVRIAAIASLFLTMVLLIANFCSVLLSESIGNLLHTILVTVSVPMVCSGNWLLSLFLWASLLMGSFIKKK